MWPRQVAPAAYGAIVGREQGGREGDEGRGNLVNNLKFKTQFCNFEFSPSSGPQMKKC